MDEAPVIFSQVRGVRHRGQTAILVAISMCPGDPVLVEREPQNKADGNAIKIVALSDYDQIVHVGYIAAEKAVVMAPWMDRGWMYTAKVTTPVKVRGSRVVFKTLRVVCRPIKPKSVNVSKKVEEHV